MRALFSNPTPNPDSNDSNDPFASQVSSPPPPPPPRNEPLPRRIKSNLGSSHHEDEGYDSQDQSGLDKSLVRPSILRPRVKLLDGSSRVSTPSRSPGNVGRIPEEHIKELDNLHQNRSIKVEKKGRSWNALQIAGKKQDTQQTPSEASEILQHGSAEQSPAAPVIENPGSHTSVPLENIDTEHLPAAAVASPQEDSQEDSQNEEAVEQTPAMSAVEQSQTPLAIGSATTTTSETPDQTDFEKYIQSTSDNEAQSPRPSPPPKDSPPLSSSSSNVQSYFNPKGLQRTESIYSFSRASFSNQLSQLTSITLPQPSSLAASIAGISNAPAAVKALTGAAEQIQIWIRKASDVLSGLDAEDDVEWAAAGGREGLEGVDKAITRFESLVHVYVNAIEQVQLRQDIGNVGPDSLKTIVVQMDSIIQSWAQIKGRLRGVKEQVELAMEWEELWANVLGDVGMEIENLSRLIFEMEEKRHFTLANEQEGTSNGLDINELETIVEETPSNGDMASKRFSMEPFFSGAQPLGMPIVQTPQDDSHSSLMALFARMQPLKASLDFLPMRLSMFQSRAERIFPSACEELEDRRNQLVKSYKMLEADAEALRKELSEDRWILVFRNAGAQAHKMFESVERSIAKLQEGIETGLHVHNPAGLTKRIESYEAKKVHYVPAIERVISIIEKGVKDRLTVNGEIMRLLSDMSSRIDALKASIKVMDSSLDDLSLSKSQHLRDSISTIITMDSPLASSVVDTPGSTTPLNPSSRRGSSVGSSATRTTMSKVRRYSGLPQAASALKSAIPKPTFSATSPSKKDTAITPTPATRKVSRLPPPPSPLNNRPRWTTSTNTNDLDVGHVYRSSTPFRKSSAPARTSRPSSTLPMPSPHRRDQSASPAPPPSRSVSRVSSRLTSRSPARGASPSPGRSILDPPPYSKLQKPGLAGLTNTPRNRQSYAGMSFSRSVSQTHDSGMLSPTKTTRPGTSLGHSGTGNRRVSLLPLPKPRSGGDSRSKLSERPPWR
ncbi:KAR9 family protein [Aspergillus novofumigatus IBT 16806]|uniref:KAR9-domain-containing protein n=1 Tax=Aspergillus novofumigatus (strain IBT 16806) TaxID=1392255 RepID=A0A2I1CLC3_ASPN1|nr:KAR9-domain-containing protein [Aspergillus novofumigatus IBT 16806]PKX98430.1 KAR9-domain-containing protein [Aspergillus novofumigatus IBT 16806]